MFKSKFMVIILFVTTLTIGTNVWADTLSQILSAVEGFRNSAVKYLESQGIREDSVYPE